MTDPANVTNNVERHQYELPVDGQIAFAEYREVGDAIMFTHTEVPQALEGRGIGSTLVRAALDDVRAQGKKAIPMCPFVAAYIRDHREYVDLVHPIQRGVLGI
ncbi:GNAT family N-acetyltransferase [Deinococcus maricopensis]|uniref:Putative acetyltransferase n=1 Tax=Deinococcus maricopensis (strain DSM 21211 / LMG 22137 / NRRL B-23946 / LB-34) TaxID=709986 RepID=E8U627_DEIML|nr:GNAT family N-acetyltransferase [Deinococcus maricopensis]ADV66516.1 putative acetyltransferase [Deinococcus maricopensis DSM 21211]